ncbi:MULTISPECIES: YciI family protein [unclassified Sphingomonas]|uniref:YciI family protein n=1 Tax=Novosphingobium rhizosphaerae TaxID=1551649 RepID=UPI0015C8309D
MPYFIFRAYDEPATSAEIRARVRPAHRDYIRQEHHGVRAVAGGMVVDDRGEAANGTMLVLEAPDRGAVLRYLEGDPYWHAGLFARFEVDRWEWGLGTPP